MLIEYLHQLGKVGQGACQAVDFVDQDNVNAPCPDICQELFERRPFHRATGKPAVSIERGNKPPTFMCLTFDIGFGCLSLRIYGIEILFQPGIIRHPGVDRAAQDFRRNHLFAGFGEAEESSAVPVGAGNRTRDCAQAEIGLLILEQPFGRGENAMLHPVMLADKDGTGFELTFFPRKFRHRRVRRLA